ncbi:MAG TPA: Uma2 family endonuclease [Nostocaceae cyanobacterium]|nr:Uma2 family endonuclease [Nostocaceae cyanobacterium]
MSTTNEIEPQKNDFFPPEELYSDEPQFESDFHLHQIMCLPGSLKLLWEDRNDFYATSNLTIYYSSRQPPSTEFPVPDFFVVLGAEKRNRNSWIVYHENGKYPNVIIELLSKETIALDKGLKKQVYQDIFRTPEYFWFDPYSLEFAGFTLISGIYQPLEPNSQGWLWSQQLNLFLGVHQNQLRYFTPEGELVLTSLEQIEKYRRITEQKQKEFQKYHQIAEQSKQELNRIITGIKKLGIDPDAI